MTRLSLRDLEAINEALSSRLADEIEVDGLESEDYEAAQAKIQAMIGSREKKKRRKA